MPSGFSTLNALRYLAWAKNNDVRGKHEDLAVAELQSLGNHQPSQTSIYVATGANQF